VAPVKISGVRTTVKAMVSRFGGTAVPSTRPTLEPATAPFPFDPSAPPVATFFEAGGNIEGGLPYTPWAAEIKKQRTALMQKDNPDANCMPMGFLQFHQQPQPRKIIQTPKMILIEYEANYGIRHIYMDGRKLPPQGEPQPWWYGYSVGHWEGDTLVVETNNLRGAEDSVNDGWLDVMIANGHVQDNISRFEKATYRQPVLFLHNKGGMRASCEDASQSAGLRHLPSIVGRGLAIGDYDNDGRMDALVVDSEGRPLLLHNETPLSEDKYRKLK